MARDKAYYVAEKKIEQARLLGETELDFNIDPTAPRNILRLTELPESIGQLTQLQSLDLSNNQLTALPKSIGQLTQLRSLVLTNNQLTWLPETIGQLTQLRSLVLTNNKLTKLPKSIGRLTQLQSLDLADHQLTKLPESIGQLTQLQSLELAHNQLESLPESIGQLTHLPLLNFSNSQLTTLPASIGQLTHLQSLDLSNNQLTTLPESIGQLTQLQSLDLSYNQLTKLPESLGQLTQLQTLDLTENQLTALPESLGQLTQLQTLDLSNNQLAALPESLGNLRQLVGLLLDSNTLTDLPNAIGLLSQLRVLSIADNQFTSLPKCVYNLENLKSLGATNNDIKILPETIGNLRKLTSLILGGINAITIPSGEFKFEFDEYNDDYVKDKRMGNNLNTIPVSLAQLTDLQELVLDNNPLNPELTAAYEQGLDAIKAYLRAKADAQITLNEAKLILVGEGEVGKTCLMDALLGNLWQEHPSTHGIEIKSFKVTDPDSNTEITLNGWDFGGQRVYRPTHQLFFSAPAVYLVVWKPREGPQQGFVKEWIQLVKHREPTAKILVVATHGGPRQSQPDIDHQELWDLFGKDTVIDFFFVESKPDEQGKRRGIEELKRAIARVAATLPEVGHSVPKRWQEAREALAKMDAAYLPLNEVLDLCRARQMDSEEARVFVTIEHSLGHLIHYKQDPALRDIVILKPNWLATAISFVLEDEVTRIAHGLVHLSRLSQLWDDPSRAADFRYNKTLHPIFLRLMEQFDLSYPVADPSPKSDSDPQTLIAQLVLNARPENDLKRAWSSSPVAGDIQQVQVCRIVDSQNGQSASAEGLFYQLIVRLHRYSLGRIHYNDSVHWQRGLVLDDGYNGRAMLEHMGNDVRITVRAAFPERFLAMLTGEVKYLVESFWEGLRCDVMVPCVNPCGKKDPGTGLFEVEKLIESKRKNRPEYPCPVCNEWQNIDHLLRNAPAAQPDVTTLIFAEFAEVKAELVKARQQLTYQGEKMMGRFDRLDDRTRRILSRVDKTYADLLQVLTDEAKEGPRLFSFEPVDRSSFNPREWIRAKFRLTLWCEHSRLPLPELNEKDKDKGVYVIELDREWFKKASPYLKLLVGTLSLVLPVASSSIKLALNDGAYKTIEEQLDFGKSVIAATLDEATKIGESMGVTDTTSPEQGTSIRAKGATLRELHALLRAKDPSFGGLIRVMNKRREFLWVHEQFASEY